MFEFFLGIFSLNPKIIQILISIFLLMLIHIAHIKEMLPSTLILVQSYTTYFLWDYLKTACEKLVF